MVLQERIELSTSPLPRECSTTELLQRRGACGDGAAVRGGSLDAKPLACKSKTDPPLDPSAPLR